MPRISDTFLHCCIYLYPSRPGAEGGIPYGGSGFLVSVPSGEKKLAGGHPRLRFDMAGGIYYPDTHIYIVTNRHVADDNCYARLTGRDGQEIVEIDRWYKHDTSDLAVAPVKWNRPWEQERDYGISVIPHFFCLSKAHLNVLEVGPGDDTFCVGRFIAHDGREKNLPIVRFGNIAMLPLEPVQIEGVGFQNCFLVESRIIQGYSGSPVFLSIPPWELRESAKYRNWIADDLGDLISEEKDQVGYYIRLLGVVAALCPDPINPKNPNTGMMAVIPAWELLDLLDSEVLREQRRNRQWK